MSPSSSKFPPHACGMQCAAARGWNAPRVGVSVPPELCGLMYRTPIRILFVVRPLRCVRWCAVLSWSGCCVLRVYGFVRIASACARPNLHTIWQDLDMVWCCVMCWVFSLGLVAVVSVMCSGKS